jgi:hypothetical protein
MELKLSSEHLQKRVPETFPTLSDFLTASNNGLPQEIIPLIIQHLQGWKNSPANYFPRIIYHNYEDYEERKETY